MRQSSTSRNTTVKVSDYVATWLKSKGLSHVFCVQGGAIVHLLDSCERVGPKPIYCHHEQAAGFAASAYARIHGMGCAIVTTGPGATNALTPILGAWQDSIPLLVISGQQRAEQTSYGKAVRQVGTQEAPIVDIVEPITKAAIFVASGKYIATYLDTAYQMATSKRPGPVWLDIAQDCLWSELHNT